MTEPEPTEPAPSIGGPGKLAVTYQGRGLTAEEVAEDASNRAAVYADDGNHEVAVVDGHGARVVVERGHLELHDGVGADRRVRRYPKILPPRRVVVGVGTTGVLSLEALRWCSATGTSLVVLGSNGAHLAGGPPGRQDARLLRAQAFALYGPAGLAVVRYLVSEKLAGQGRVLRYVMADDSSADTCLALANQACEAESIEHVRQLEAGGANLYFSVWESRVRVGFARVDANRIPEHWARFNGRRSTLNPGSPRNAVDPAGAIVNYSYRLAEVEATLAARRLGLDPGMGILHADAFGRPSLACDLMEPIRPVVDLHCLGVLAGPLRKRSFFEDASGVVRCRAPLTHQLAEAMPSYAENLAPVVETVAAMLGASSPYDVKVPTALSWAKHRTAARRRVDTETGEIEPSAPAPTQGPNPGAIRPRRGPRARARKRPPLAPPLPVPSCQGCGGPLPIDSDRDRPRIAWCADCLPDRRQELGAAIGLASQRAAQRFEQATGDKPTHTPEASTARAAGNARARQAQAAFDQAESLAIAADWFRTVVVPALAGFTLPTIAKATGVSTSGAAKWRAGRTVPHRRHWASLAELVGVEPSEKKQPSSTIAPERGRNHE